MFSLPAPVPQDLLCLSCMDLLCDAVMLPCCAASLCYVCARQEIDGGVCPLCGDLGIQEDDLIPYRLVRDKVCPDTNSFFLANISCCKHSFELAELITKIWNQLNKKK